MMDDSLTDSQRAVLLILYDMQVVSGFVLLAILITSIVILGKAGRTPFNDFTAFVLLAAALLIFGTSGSRVYFTVAFRMKMQDYSIVDTWVSPWLGWIATAAHGVAILGMIMFLMAAIKASRERMDYMMFQHSLLYAVCGLLALGAIESVIILSIQWQW